MVGPVRSVRLAPLMWWSPAYRWMYRTGRTPWDTGVTPPEVVELIEGPSAPSPGRALDLGCGTGTNVRYLAEHGWEAIGVDAVPAAIDRATVKLAGVSNARVILGDVTELERLDLAGPFDLMLDIGCFHSIERRRRPAYAAGVASLTRPGAGLFVFAFARRNGPVPLGVSPAEMATRFAPWFEPVGRIRGATPPGAAWYLLRRASAAPAV
ncbi:MAG: class I SAM-dependent methyltransferase [Actinomycetota bacterium]|nr:class I SAM-dependent methyltransferase [Actinomycetota bacterium]